MPPPPCKIDTNPDIHSTNPISQIYLSKITPLSKIITDDVLLQLPSR